MRKPRIESEPPAAPRVGYPLHAERPASDIIDESCATLKRAVARAAELARAGYSVEIGGLASPAKG